MSLFYFDESMTMGHDDYECEPFVEEDLLNDKKTKERQRRESKKLWT